jgi:hypothetical protein
MTEIEGGVWTNTNPAGDGYGDETSCNGWGDDGNQTIVGAPNTTSMNWTNIARPHCGGNADLYCFQQD